MMKKIGCFRKEGSDLVGQITLLHFHVKARIVAASSKSGSDGHDFVIVHDVTNNFASELGLAWQKQSRHGGFPFLSVKIDDPLCPYPIHAFLCEDQDGLFYLYWDRNATSGELPEDFFLDEDHKLPLGIFRSFQRLTTQRLQDLVFN